MNKRLIIVFVIICISVWIFTVGYLLPSSWDTTIPTSEETETGAIDENPIKTQKEINKEIVKQKIERIKKRAAIKGLISQGDSYFEQDELTLALQRYIKAYRQSDKDPAVLEKIWDTYFELKKFKSAYNNYKELEPTERNIDKIILSLIYAKDVSSPEKRSEIMWKLSEIDMDEQRDFYYNNALSCITDFHNCKVNYGNFFSEKVDQDGIIEPRVIKNSDLLKIQTAIQNYENFQVDQVYFKDALIIWAFFENKLYPVAIELWKRLLEEKTDYKPIIKILAESYFRLGKYEDAKTYLTQYHDIDQNDPYINYMLAVIHMQDKDYLLSNIFFNKAIELGYSPSIDARRNLIYNYFLLESEENLLGSLKDLVENEENISSHDLRLAIYYHILYERYDEAKKWIELGFSKYPENENFHGYLGWIEKEKWRHDEARVQFEKGLELESENPFLTLNMGLLEKETWNKKKAIVYFKKTISNNGDGEFSIEAKRELEKLEKENALLKDIFQ